jgi:protein-L-isoaspartate(D-aspartate) O-methyltransferase
MNHELTEPMPDDAFAIARRRMVREQLQDRDIRDPRVLEAMRRVPRHFFLPEHLHNVAYDDCALPLEHGQTISQPFIVAFMTEELELEPEHRVLEIGTGCGYQTAVLAALAKEVFTIEIVEPLAKAAEQRLQKLGCANVHVRWGDGHLGWPEQAPFDAVIVTCAPESIPAPLISQLREGGRMMIPVGAKGVQELILLTKEDGELQQMKTMQVRFVPMTGTEDASTDAGQV